MALFEFDLAPVEDIVPWGEAGNRSLSWFALTDGLFRVRVGGQTLFEYTQEIQLHSGIETTFANYQIAAFVRDILGSVAPAIVKLPEAVERLASNWDLLTRLRRSCDTTNDLDYTAWSWLGERSPWTSYLVAHPHFQFVRISDEIQIHWDNRERLIDGMSVWTAQHGVYLLPVESFLEQCRAFADRLLTSMEGRIAGIEAGVMRPQVEVSGSSLRQQHASWKEEFDSYFKEHEPDIPWEQVEEALIALASKHGVPF